MVKNRLVELVKYGFWGGITVGINMGLFYLLNESGLYYLLASMIAYYIAVIINYFLNYHLVFNQPNEDVKGKLNKLGHFLGLRTFSLLVDTVLFFALVNLIGINVYAARVGLALFIIMVNYLWSRTKIFVKQGDERV